MKLQDRRIAECQDWKDSESAQSVLRFCTFAILQSLALAGPAARRIQAQFLGHVSVAGLSRRRQLQHPRHVALDADWIAEDVVVHAAPLRPEAGILDVAHDLQLVHAVARTR